VKTKDKVEPCEPGLHVPFMGHFLTYDDQVNQLVAVLMKDAHSVAVKSDLFYDKKTNGDHIASMHNEVSHLLEALKCANLPSENIPEFTKVEEAAADVMIKLLDWSEARRLKLSEALLAKMKFNKGQIKTKR